MALKRAPSVEKFVSFRLASLLSPISIDDKQVEKEVVFVCFFKSCIYCLHLLLQLAQQCSETKDLQGDQLF